MLTEDWLKNHVLKVLFFLSFLLYSNTIPNEYCLDDELVTQNHRLTSKGIAAIPEILEEPYYKDDMGYSYGYRPVTLIFFAVTHEIWGENPHAEHLINALLYACLVVLFFVFIRKLFPHLEFWPAFFAAVFFAVYPPHTEVVASLKNRDELLSFLGGLAAGVFLFNEAMNPIKAAVFAILAFAFGVYSKNSIILFPVLFSWIVFLIQRQADLRLLVFGIPAILLSAYQLEGIKGVQWYGFVAVSILSVLLPYRQLIRKKIGLLIHSSRFQKLIGLGNSGSSLGVEEKTRPIPFKLFITTIPLWLVLGYVMPVPAAVLLIITSAFAYLLFFKSPGSVWFPLSMLLAWVLLYHHRYFSSDIIDLLGPGFLMLIARNLRKPVSAPVWMLLTLFSFSLMDSGYITNPTELLGYALVLLIFWLAIHKQGKTISWLPSLLLFLGWLLEWQSPEKYSWEKRVWFYSGGLMGLSVLLSSLGRLSSRVVTAGSAVLIPFAVLYGLYSTSLPESDTSLKTRGLQDLRMAADRLPEAPVTIVSNRPLNEIEIPLGFQTSPDTLVATAAMITSSYLAKLVFPWPMACYYGYKTIVPLGPSDPQALMGYIGIALLAGIFLLALFKRNALLSAGSFWLILALLPYSNLIGRVPGMMADRYLLIPSAAFALMAAALLSRLLKHRLRQSTLWLTVVLLYALPASAITLFRNTEWKNHLSLLRADIETVPESVQVNNLLASHLIIQATKLPAGEAQNAVRREAEIYFAKAVELYPYFFNTWYDLGRTRFLLEEWEGALTAFNQAEKIKPDFPELQAYQAKSMCKIGLKYEQQGSFNQAMDWYEKAIFEDSICEMAYNSKAFLFFKQQKPEEAARCLQLGVKQVPESFDLNANLGKVYMQLQMADSALIWFKRALQIRPGDPQLQGVISSIESSLQP